MDKILSLISRVAFEEINTYIIAICKCNKLPVWEVFIFQSFTLLSIVRCYS